MSAAVFVTVAAMGLVFVAVAAAADAPAQEKARFYLTGLVGGSAVDYDSGGTNTAGPHLNTGDDSEAQVFGGGAIGAAFPLGPVVLRAEVEGEAGRGTAKIVTNSFQPPVPTFFYNTRVTVPWTILGNVWLDYPLRNLWPDVAVLNSLEPFAGAGLGASRFQVSTTDFVVAGREESTELSWQVGGGLAYRVNDWLTLEARYRYMNLGKVDTPLTFPNPSGRYRLDITANEGIGGIRLTLP